MIRMKVPSMSALLVGILIGTASPANAQALPASVPGVNPQEVCIIPTSPEIKIFVTDETGSPLNVWVSLNDLGPDGNGNLNQANYSHYPEAGGCGELQGCFENGRAKFTTTSTGEPLPRNIYSVQVYPPYEGVEGTYQEVNATAGGPIEVRIILRHVVATMSQNIEETTFVQGYLNLAYNLKGSIPSGTQIYTAIQTSGPSNRMIMWEANRKNFSAGEYNGQLIKQPRIFVEGVPVGYYVCAATYISLPGAPTRPIASSEFQCFYNKKQ